MKLKKYSFEQIATNSTSKKLPEASDKDFYIGLEHIEPDCFEIKRPQSTLLPTGEKLIIKKGDVLFGKRRAYQRKVAIAPFDGIFSAHGFVFRPNTEIISPEYFPFFIRSKQFLDRAIKISVGGLSPTINWKDLKQQEFDLPSLADQKKLADKLWATYRLKESYKKLLASMDELVKSRFMEQFIIGTPYERKSLGDYISQVRGVSYKPKDLRSSLSEDSVLLLRANNISSGVINHDEVQYVAKGKVSATQILQTGDILICASSGSLEHVGKAAICFSSIVGETFGAFCKLIRTNGALLPEYIAAYLKTDEYREIIMQLACGSNINNLKTEHIDNLQIPVPPIDVQESFVSFVRQLDKSKLELQKSIAAIDDVIKSLIN